jgi:hypothetical protein
MATTIQIRNNTLDRLKFFRGYSKESYDEILNKIMDDIEEGELTEDAIKDIQEGLLEVKKGKGQRIEDVAKELGVKL